MKFINQFIFISTFIIHCSLSIICPPCEAQNQTLQFEHLSGKNSLPQNSVYAICQDKQGFLWFGTADGLCRYDGTEMKIFRYSPDDSNSLPGNFIRKLLVDSAGNLWIGTENGLCRYNPYTEKIERIHIPDSKNLLLPAFPYCELPTGQILFGAPDNLFFNINPLSLKTEEEIFSNEAKKAFHNSSLYTIFRVKNFLVFSENGSIAIYNYVDKTLKTISINDTNFHYLNYATCAGDSLYLAIYNGVLIMDLKTCNYRHVDDLKVGDKVTKIGFVNTLTISPQGNVLIGTNENGLFIADSRLRIATHFLNNSGDKISVSFNSIRTLFYDHSGNLWVGTDGEGINKSSVSNRFKKYNIEQNGKEFLSGDFIRCFYEDERGYLYVGTHAGGLTIINPDRTSSEFYKNEPGNPKSIPGNNILCIYSDSKNNLWIGTDAGLALFNRNTVDFKRIKSDNDLNNTINDLIEISPGKILVGTGDLPDIVNTDSVLRIEILKDTDLLNVVTFTKDFHSNVYAASRTKYLRNKPMVRHSIGKTNVYTFADAQNCYADYAGNIWVAGKEGLEKWSMDGKLLKRYTEKDGLPDPYLYSILEDRKGNLWISSNNGISKFNKQSEVFRNYDITDGLQGGEYNSNAYYKSKNGEFIFGGIHGFNSFFPDSIKDNLTVPVTVITSFRIFDKEWKSDSSINIINDLVLPYYENTLSFKLASLEFTQPDQNLIRYRLLGLDTNWVDIGAERSISFMGLSPGSYVLEVKSCNNDGIWNIMPKRLYIHIIPPIWQTTWFRVLSVACLLILIIFTVRFFATRKLKAQLEEIKLRHLLEKERTRISQDMHDEIGSGLSKISILSELAGNDKTQPTDRHQHMNKITTTSRQLVDNMQEIIWSLNPRNDTLSGLLSYMHEYANEFFESTNINLVFEYPVLSNDETIYIKNTVRRNIFLAFKETLNNIVKHSGANEVKIIFSYSGLVLQSKVKDNGKGIAENDFRKSGNGLQNMEKRMKESNGDVHFLSDKNAGTTITFTIRLEKENTLTT